MLSSFKNLKNKAKEMVSTVSHGGKVGKIHDISKESSTFSGVFGYIENGVLHDYREALDLDKEIKKQWFSSVSNGKAFPKMYKSGYEVHDAETWEARQKNINLLYDIHDEETLRMYRDYLLGVSADSNDVNHSSKMVSGDVPKEVVKELYGMQSNKIKFAALEENLDENFIPFPVARLAIAGKDPVCLRDFLEASKCKEYGIDAITICKPDENKTRGVRLTLCEDEDRQEIRSYEVLNGSYDMTIAWEVEGKKCQMDISVSSDGSAKILKRNGVIDEQICAHQDVMVGKQHETKFLYEALGLQQTQEKSTEKVKPSLNRRSKPKAVEASSSKEGAKIEQLVEKNPEAKSALKEFASEVQEESSESMKPLTNVTKADVKGAGSSIQR
ncbi:hypothetical protein [Wolbachia endosymbiont of Armadillidium arcangelii]|uniref:Uncharacterized protein n=1 Tax=Wolbachia endosymbiont of Armadillidium arcangelii TaxID=3158571 RepID=A0AAU7Q1R6_9RICK